MRDNTCARLARATITTDVFSTTIVDTDRKTSLSSADGYGLAIYSHAFFFQAEDGKRDVERSRGLGDVYKGQDYKGI